MALIRAKKLKHLTNDQLIMLALSKMMPYHELEIIDELKLRSRDLWKNLSPEDMKEYNIGNGGIET